MEGIALNRALQGARGRVDSGLRKASLQLNEYRAAARKHYRNGKFHAQVRHTAPELSAKTGWHRVG